MTVPFATGRPAELHDVLAPDGSQIRFLPQVKGGSMVHCTLPPGTVSLAVTHRTVDELWYVLAGEGERKFRSQLAGHLTVDSVERRLRRREIAGVQCRKASNPDGTPFPGILDQHLVDDLLLQVPTPQLQRGMGLRQPNLSGDNRRLAKLV